MHCKSFSPGVGNGRLVHGFLINHPPLIATATAILIAQMQWYCEDDQENIKRWAAYIRMPIKLPYLPLSSNPAMPCRSSDAAHTA